MYRPLLPRLATHLLRCPISSEPLSLPDAVNEVCRVLSDHRAPHHELDPALRPFAAAATPDLVLQVLKRCRNLPSAALRFFHWANAQSQSLIAPVSHRVLIDILGANHQFPLIWAHLSETRLHNPLDPSTFHLLFRLYSRAGLADDAVRAFSKMPDFAMKPDIVDVQQLLFSLCRNGLVAQAQVFFDNSKMGFPPDPKFYTILMGGWASVGNSENARKLFDEMLQRGCPVDLMAFNTLLASMCKSEELDQAYRELGEMRSSHGLEPDASTYAIFVRASYEAKDLHTCMKVMDTMRRRGLVLNVFTYNCVIKLLCEKEKVEVAYELLDEMIGNDAKPDTWSYNTILDAHCRVREVNKALRLLVRMDKDGCSPDRHTYNMLLKMLIRVGRIDRVVEVWDGMEGRGFYPSASSYAVMIHGLSRKKGRVEEACRYFEIMVEEGIPPYQSTCELLRGQLLRLGLRDRVIVLADKMQRSSSCTIQELSSSMEGSKRIDRAEAE